MPRAIKTDVIILGAGAAGMLCAIEAGRRGRSVTILDHAKAPGEKIRISGGGRCNFTNVNCEPKHFLSGNRHFAISALKSFTAADFIARVKQEGIAFHEKTLGQLFCDGSSRQIVTMLTDAMAEAMVDLRLRAEIHAVSRIADDFQVSTSVGDFTASSLVVATGGKSIPKMGATGLGYELAGQFGHAVTETRPALVPLTWPSDMADEWGRLSGVSLPVRVRCRDGMFDEAMLMTHRGISGPAMLQISSYWREGDAVEIDLLPDQNVEDLLKEERRMRARATLATVLADHLPKRLAQLLAEQLSSSEKRLGDLSNVAIGETASLISHFQFRPGGTEGYRTAEVTLGGVDTNGLNQKTMESKHCRGLYIIGEAVDVTGHLGGHNFQWAWSSAVAAGRHI